MKASTGMAYAALLKYAVALLEGTSQSTLGVELVKEVSRHLAVPYEQAIDKQAD